MMKRPKTKGFQLLGASPPHPLTRGSAPGPCWGLRPQTPIIASRSRAQHLCAPLKFLVDPSAWISGAGAAGLSSFV